MIFVRERIFGNTCDGNSCTGEAFEDDAWKSEACDNNNACKGTSQCGQSIIGDA